MDMNEPTNYNDVHTNCNDVRTQTLFISIRNNSYYIFFFINIVSLYLI